MDTNDRQLKSFKNMQELVRSFKRMSEQSAMGAEEPLIEAVQNMEPDEAIEIALVLLDSESDRLQRAARRVLAVHPTPKAVDKIWSFYKRRFPNGSKGLSSEDYPLFPETNQALLACTRKDPAWLEKAIQDSDPATEPLQSLVYALAGVKQQGQAVWLKEKSRLMSLYNEGDDQRCLIMNIRAHHDADEVEWLKGLLPQKQITGVQALWALARLDINLAIEGLPSVDGASFSMCRQWCFAELWSLAPKRTLDKIACVIQEASNPWRWAQTFQDYEALMPHSTCEFLLSNFEELLAKELDSPSPDNQVPLWAPLQLLSSLNTAEQLACFQRHSGKRLEDLLTTWLWKLGPREAVYARHQIGYALNVLCKIGGQGYTEVMNSYLQSSHQYGRLDGLEIAPKRPDSKTIKLLGEITVSDYMWSSSNSPGYVGEPFPVEQDMAVTALAYLQEWQSVLRAVSKWGSHITEDLVEERSQIPLECSGMISEFKAEAFAEAPNRNAMVALGLSGAKEALSDILNVLSSFESDSEIAVACALALEYLGDTSPQVEAAFVKLLANDRCRYVAARTLVKFKTQTSEDALLLRLEQGFDSFIYSQLSLVSRFQEQLGTILWHSIQSKHSDAMLECNIRPLGYLSDPEVRDYIEGNANQNAGIPSGARPFAIEAWEVYDPKAAFDAAVRFLREPKSHGRELLPRILFRLNRDKGLDAIFEQARTEEDWNVYYSITSSLAQHCPTEQVKSWFADSNASVRRIACHVAAELNESDFSDQVQAQLADPDMSLTRAAREAMMSWHRRQCLDQLLQKYTEAESNADQWIFRDSILALAFDPQGNTNSPVFQHYLDAVTGSAFVESYVSQKRRRSRSKKRSTPPGK